MANAHFIDAMGARPKTKSLGRIVTATRLLPHRRSTGHDDPDWAPDQDCGLCARLTPLVRHQNIVAQEDRTRADFNVTAGLQILHDAAHHLAGRANHLGDILLG